MRKLKILLFLISATVLANSRSSFAASYSTDHHQAGLGIVLGEPTGLTGKFWMGKQAVDAGLSYSFNDFFLLYSDYLFHFPEIFRSASEKWAKQFEPYVGIGGILFISTTSDPRDHTYFREPGSSSVGFGIRIPIGLEWMPMPPPIGVFAEIVPGVGVVPSTFGFVQGGIGIRYYF
jgi:hypothetical protein